MDSEGAAIHPPDDQNLSQPLPNHPPIQNGLRKPDAAPAAPDGPALPRRGYHPHTRPPGLRTPPARPSGADLQFEPDASAAPLFTSLVCSSRRAPWYRSLANAFRREHLPPLVVTSKPVPVVDIWGQYDYRKRSLLSSTTAHLAVVFVLFTTLTGSHLPGNNRQSINLSIPVEISRFLPAPPQQGGGGGGENSPLPANQGPLPRFDLRQLTPPRPQLVKAKPRLAVSPSLLSPNEQQPNLLDLSLLGSPLNEIGPPSAGQGEGGGIGSGRGSGIGSGRGSGVGPGEGSGADAIFEVGGEVAAPVLRVRVDPEYPEQARVKRLQGAVLLSIEVWPDGRAHNVQVVRGLGLGLDERAMEAVRKWEFEPGTKDGKPVRVACRVEVVFQLF